MSCLVSSFSSATEPDCPRYVDFFFQTPKEYGLRLLDDLDIFSLPTHVVTPLPSDNVYPLAVKIYTAKLICQITYRYQCPGAQGPAGLGAAPLGAHGHWELW